MYWFIFMVCHGLPTWHLPVCLANWQTRPKIGLPTPLGLKHAPTTIEGLKEAVTQVWDQITVKDVDKYAGSMEERVQAVIAAKGSHTWFWSKIFCHSLHFTGIMIVYTKNYMLKLMTMSCSNQSCQVMRAVSISDQWLWATYFGGHE